MDMELQQLLRQWRSSPDPQLAMRIAALVSRSSDDIKSERPYALLFNERQAQVIINSTDLYSRVLIGQVDELLEPFRRHSLYATDWDNIHTAQDILNQQVKPLLFPGMPPNASHGIRSPQVADDAKVSFDIHQVVRHRMAWDRERRDLQTSGRSRSNTHFCGVHHDAPRGTSTKQPLPGIVGPEPCYCGKRDCVERHK